VNVDVYRNGQLRATTVNDGRYVNTRVFQGAATYIFKVCEAGTTMCSNEATVVFK
jgi:thermitase